MRRAHEPRAAALLALALAGAGCGRCGYDAHEGPGDGAVGADTCGGLDAWADSGSPPVASGQLFYSPDLTGDGVADLAVGSTDGAYLFEGGAGLSPTGVGDAFAQVTAAAPCAIDAGLHRADLNADGATDLLVGYRCTDGTGLALLSGPISGGSHAVMDQQRFLLSPEGWTAARIAVGDLSGDGNADLVVSYSAGTARSGLATGVVRVFFDLASLPERPTADVTLEGEADGDSFGQSIDTRPGDVTGDGVPDLLVGAPRADMTGTDSGGAYLFAGPLSPGTHVAPDIAVGRYQGRHGGSLAGVGTTLWDANADGSLDLVVGADEDNGAGAYSGRVFIFFGPVDPGVRSLAESNRTVTGTPPDEFGTFLESSGDLTGDGFRDLLLWACCGNEGTLRGVGNLSGVFASPTLGSLTRDTVDFHYRGEWDRGRWGVGVAVGDVNADGIDDFVALHPQANGGDGAVYLYWGRRGAWPAGTPTATADLVIPGPAGVATDFGVRSAAR